MNKQICARQGCNNTALYRTMGKNRTPICCRCFLKRRTARLSRKQRQKVVRLYFAGHFANIKTHLELMDLIQFTEQQIGKPITVKVPPEIIAQIAHRRDPGGR